MANKSVKVSPIITDYATLNDAVVGEVAANYNLTPTGLDGILTIACHDDAADTEAVYFGNFSTDQDHYPRVTVDVSYRHIGVWSDSKYRLETASASSTLALASNYVRFEYLQIRNSGTGGGYNAVSVTNGGATAFIGCIFRGTANLYADNGSVFNNCVFLDPTYTANVLASGVGTHVFINCIFIAATSFYAIYSYTGAQLQFTNCYFAGASDLFATADTSTQTFTNCACSSAETATGLTANVAFTTANFLSVTFGDATYLKLARTGALTEAGVDMSANANWRVGSAIDIAGHSRPTWDIGPFALTQWARPSVDVSGVIGGWVDQASGTTDLSAAIGESTLSDVTYVRSNAALNDDTYATELSDVAAPSDGTVRIYVRARSL